MGLGAGARGRNGEAEGLPHAVRYSGICRPVGDILPVREGPRGVRQRYCTVNRSARGKIVSNSSAACWRSVTAVANRSLPCSPGTAGRSRRVVGAAGVVARGDTRGDDLRVAGEVVGGTLRQEGRSREQRRDGGKRLGGHDSKGVGESE